MTKPRLEILYDGDCPFCASYVKMIRIQENYICDLLNARERIDLVEKFSSQGMEVSEGFIVTLHGQSFHGAEALSLLSRLSASKGLLNRTMAAAFRWELVARLSCPVMKLGRSVTLRLLGLQSRIG